MQIINKLLKEKTDNLLLQFFRYIFVGGTAFVIDFGLLYVFTSYLNIYYLISAVLSFLISVLVNYVMSTKWVFNQDNINNKLVEFNLFILISTIGLVFTEIILYLLTDICGIYYMISKIIASILVLFWNFSARRVMYYGKKL
ncbi:MULTISPECIES: GtrA family protein [unclassified Methanobrevibacter]|uniref:GtrA family protein n=1 Tax=unclassified Methanobrevibacter TaxID=2638681 RepID=UPI0039B8F057